MRNIVFVIVNLVIQTYNDDALHLVVHNLFHFISFVAPICAACCYCFGCSPHIVPNKFSSFLQSLCPYCLPFFNIPHSIHYFLSLPDSPSPSFSMSIQIELFSSSKQNAKHLNFVYWACKCIAFYVDDQNTGICWQIHWIWINRRTESV